MLSLCLTSSLPAFSLSIFASIETGIRFCRHAVAGEGEDGERGRLRIESRVLRLISPSLSFVLVIPPSLTSSPLFPFHPLLVHPRPHSFALSLLLMTYSLTQNHIFLFHPRHIFVHSSTGMPTHHMHHTHTRCRHGNRNIRK